MATELQYLLSAIGLYLVMILMQAVAATVSRKASVSDLVGPRDELPASGLSPFHGRTKRAQANFTESLILFAPLVLIAAHLDAFTQMTALGSALFFYGRLAFAVFYYLGTPWARTLSWFVSIVGIILFLVELVL
ncbi:MAG: MAPEG family protein [Litorimonas sp.]